MALAPDTIQEQENRHRRTPEGGGIEFFHAADGWRLRYGHWQTALPCKGTMFVLPGRTEFVEKYFEVVSDLMRRGFNVVVLDWRGQGLSGRLLKDEPEKNHLEDFSLLGDDFSEFLTQAGRKRFAKPWFSLAHSTGALCQMQCFADHPSSEAKFEKAVFTSPFFGMRFTPLGEARTRALVKNALEKGKARNFIPIHGKYGWKVKSFFTRDRLTSDVARFENIHWFIDENPALALGGVTYGWLAAAIQATDRLQQSALPGRLKMPMLFVLAGRERVVDNGPAEDFIGRLPTASMVKLQDARHEILMERDEIRDIFWKLFDNFLSS